MCQDVVPQHPLEGFYIGPMWAQFGPPTSDPKQSVRQAEIGLKWATLVGWPLWAQHIGRQAM